MISTSDVKFGLIEGHAHVRFRGKSSRLKFILSKRPPILLTWVELNSEKLVLYEIFDKSTKQGRNNIVSFFIKEALKSASSQDNQANIMANKYAEYCNHLQLDPLKSYQKQDLKIFFIHQTSSAEQMMKNAN